MDDDDDAAFDFNLDLFDDISAHTSDEGGSGDVSMDTETLLQREEAQFGSISSGEDWGGFPIGDEDHLQSIRRMNTNSLANLRRGGGRRRRSPGWGDSDDDDGAVEDDVLVAAVAEAEGGGEGLTVHGQRMRKDMEEWDNIRKDAGEQWLQTAGLRNAHAQQLRDVELEMVQQRACKDWKFHKCGQSQRPCWLSRVHLDAVSGDQSSKPSEYQAAFNAAHNEASPGEGVSMVVRSLYTVTYVSHACRHRLFVPVWHCQECDEAFCASPLRAGCWPTRALNSSTWIAEGFLEDCRRLVMKGGLSFTRECGWCDPFLFRPPYCSIF
jgi:hypothetical protein